MYETIMQKLCRELETIENKLKGGAEMSEADLNKVDKISHALKCLAAYEAMHEQYPQEYSRADRQMSGRRYSMESEPWGMSEHYPPMPYYGRRW